MSRTPLMPWGSPLYNELYLGLCRALLAPWLGAVGTFTGSADDRQQQTYAPADSATHPPAVSPMRPRSKAFASRPRAVKPGNQRHVV